MELIKTFDFLEEQIKGTDDVPEITFLPSEISFVTATNVATHSFFAQFCRWSFLELIKFNEAIRAACKPIADNRALLNSLECDVDTLHVGQIICAKYSFDKKIYRAYVLNKSEIAGKVRVMFVDYGNIEMVKLKDVYVIDEPCIKRMPFGVACVYRGSKKFSEQDWAHFLKCISNRYVLVKPTDRINKYLYEVEIPLNYGYNLAFLNKFRPEVYRTFGNPIEASVGGKRVKRFDRYEQSEAKKGSHDSSIASTSSSQSNQVDISDMMNLAMSLVDKQPPLLTQADIASTVTGPLSS